MRPWVAFAIGTWFGWCVIFAVDWEYDWLLGAVVIDLVFRLLRDPRPDADERGP